MYSVAGKVDIGAYEKQNDDRALIGSHILEDGEFSGIVETDYIFATVCDGVGGMYQGYRAAMMTIEECQFLHRADVTISDIKGKIEIANKKIKDLQCAENLQNGLRTTIAGVYLNAEHFWVFNAGDSRVYRFRFRYLTQLSKDHSLVQDMVDIGEISAEAAKTHPQKNVINKCIGHEPVVNPRIIDMSDDIEADDIIMICSDGVSDELEDADFKEILWEHSEDESLLECCRLIYQKAIEKGSKDNLSIILLRMGE